MNQPVITIITPSFNRVGMIQSAIQSVLDQNYPEVEHIIIDGGSTDGTLDVLKKYPHLRIVSEPDMGMYDALNKGLALATGELVGILNSDDCYPVGTFLKVMSIFTADTEADAVWGNADMIRLAANGENFISLLRPPREEDDIVQYLLIEVPIFNACFFHRHVFEHWGPFMAQLKIAGDREFMLRIALAGCKFHMTETLLYHYYVHDDSMTFNHNPSIFELWNMEHCEIAEFYLGRQSLPGKARAAYRRMHTNSNLTLIKIAFKKGNFSRAFGFAQQGWRVNPKWPLIFINRCLEILGNALRGENSDDFFESVTKR